MTHLLELFHDKLTMFHTRVFYKKVQNLTKQKGHPQQLQHSSNFQSIRLIFCNTSSPSCICKEQEVKNSDRSEICHLFTLLAIKKRVVGRGQEKTTKEQAFQRALPSTEHQHFMHDLSGGGAPNNLIQTLRKHFSLYKIRTNPYFTHPTTMHLLMESH